LLAGDFPYGTKVSKATTVSAQRRLIYKSVVDEHTEIPKWVDFALQKALSPFPHKRYDEISEFIYDLKHPNPEFVKKFKAPLIDRKPILFYKGLSTLLLIIIVGLVTYIRQMQ
jgi:hypothetical protein